MIVTDQADVALRFILADERADGFSCTEPHAPRTFRTPWVPVVPALGILLCIAAMFALPAITWINLAVWMALGFAVYFGYSRKHSKLAKPNG